MNILEETRKLKEKVFDNKPWDWGFVAVVNQLETNMDALLKKNAELEAALTDALYAWGLFEIFIESELSSSTQKTYEEAQERIQRARLALPKAQEVNNATT